MYPIVIKYEKELIYYEDIISIENKYNITLGFLKKHLKDDETFYTDTDKWEIRVPRSRFETDEEFKERITKAEKYMENYNKFHNKK